MPLVPGSDTSQVFYNTDNILIYARVLANDVQGGTSGQNLADARPITWPLLNLCYDSLAAWLEDNNVNAAMYAEARVIAPASAQYNDPSAESRLGYDGFVDAAGNFYDSPTLPDDFLDPLFLWQRSVTLQDDGAFIPVAGMPFRPMKQRLGGLGNAYNYGWNGGTYGSIYGNWEYRQNSIYLLGGAYQATEFRIRYTPSVVQLTEPTEENPDPPVIYFAKAGLALARMIAAEYAEITGGKNAVLLRTKANAELQILGNRAAKSQNRAQTRMKGYGFGRRQRCR